MNTPPVIIDLGKITDWLSLIVNICGFGGAITALFLTRKNIGLLLSQIRSQSYHSQIEAHKTLFLPIIQDKELARLLADGADVDRVRANFLASMLINHASRIHNDFLNKVGPPRAIKEFIDDASDLFSIPIVRKRWSEVKAFHDLKFVLFIEKEVIPTVVESRRLNETPTENADRESNKGDGKTDGKRPSRSGPRKPESNDHRGK